MSLRFFLMMGCVLLLTGCPHSHEMHAPKVSVPAVHSGQEHRQVAVFTRVKVKGHLNVSLHTSYSHPQVILRGDPRDLPFVITTVTNGVLHVTLGTGHPYYAGVDVEIHSHHLSAFEYHGVGTITAPNLHSSSLDLVLDNPGRTTIHGQIELRKLELKGGGYTEISGINSPYLQINIADQSTVRLAGVVNLATLDMRHGGRLSLYWVKSRQLIVRGADKAFIQLAGFTSQLDVELWGEAHFNGRYLRAQRAFVKTHGKSVADMSAVMRQHTLASDTSDIHFYNLPAMKADFMANNGAVLDMRDLGMPFLQENTPYNKYEY